MNTRHCYKCGHDNEESTGDSLEACPKCGAIYTRVEAYMRAQKNNMRSNRAPVTPEESADFVEEIRANSLYPNFRGTASFFYWLTVGAAGITLFSGIVAATKGIGGTYSFFVSFFIALFMTVIAKAGKELSFMLADMADASVFTAASHRKDND